MAKTQDLKRRIRSVKNTRQLTKAMKMVSAAKLRRAQERIDRARPYATRQRDVLASLASRAEGDSHPLLAQHEGNRTEILVVSGDKGLCGAFNAQVCKAAQAFAEGRHQDEIVLTCLGKKASEYFHRRKYNIRRDVLDAFRNVEYKMAENIAEELMGRYIDGKVDRIYLHYNEIVSAISAAPKMIQLLPVATDVEESGESDLSDDYIYEPNAQALFRALLPNYVKNQVFQAMLESAAGEHAMRMAAMDAATRNAGDLIDSLTLTMNRVRQAAITTEIIEVVSGADALS